MKRDLSLLLAAVCCCSYWFYTRCAPICTTNRYGPYVRSHLQRCMGSSMDTST